MEKELTKNILRERFRQYRVGILSAIIIVLLLLAGSYAISTFLDNNTRTPDNTDQDQAGTHPTGFPQLLADQIQQNYVNISHIVIYQNVTVNETIVSIDAKIDKQLDGTWNMSLTIISIPMDDLSNISVIDHPNGTIAENDVQDINSLIHTGINQTTVVNDTSVYENYDPRSSAVYIQILYANHSGFMFFLSGNPDNAVISYTKILWDTESGYIDISYPNEEVFLTPWSAFDPLFAKLNRIFPDYTKQIT